MDLAQRNYGSMGLEINYNDVRDEKCSINHHRI